LKRCNVSEVRIYCRIYFLLFSFASFYAAPMASLDLAAAAGDVILRAWCPGFSRAWQSFHLGFWLAFGAFDADING